MRTHTGEKPYECGVCGLRYREKERAKAHLTRSHGHLRARAGGLAHQDPLITEVKPEGAVGKLQRVEPGKKTWQVSNREARWEAALLSHDLADQLWAVSGPRPRMPPGSKDSRPSPRPGIKPRRAPAAAARRTHQPRRCPTRPATRLATQRTGQGPDSRTINSDSPDKLDCMNADDFEPVDNVGPSDSTPGPSGVAEASNNIYLRPSVPHTPWFRVNDARRKKVVAEEASAMPLATLHQREHRHGAGWPRLPRLPVEHHKGSSV
ncbi:hypothetical protein HPB51_028127 [Rhipicephalus microplus]|uniref:C2H2-type domain-containing protein n=1 Tax=Rhipicephalus microplus TaxID=6941 RepID=A0A9J6CYB3_RHIMP|nr:hypothetical protein HPB51_028127 [Rhipicephalus microplus]